MIYEHLTVNQDGVLCFANRAVTELVNTYGTPLYVMDEDKIRQNLRTYKNTMKQVFDKRAKVLFASKACDFKGMYRIVKEEGCGVDVVSGGEVFTAWSAGFPMEQVTFHGNNKTDEEIRFAMEKGVGCFVVDSMEELEAVNQIASSMNLIQTIMIRITPGIDPHTYDAVATGLVDSKFGSAVVTGTAEQLVKQALNLHHVHLSGFHCHIGSQVFDEEVFLKSAEVMLQFIKEVKEKYNVQTEELNLGGGFGVRYVESDPQMNLNEVLSKIGEYVKQLCLQYQIELPVISMEPGRSIVADAGMTLYRAGSVKRIPGIKNYVSVDGGMTDNPRYALYRSAYTVVCANRMNEKNLMKCSVVGKCCESGDILQENVLLPETIQRNDLIAVLTTGAYNYSMASNYNRICRPAVVMIHDGQDRLVVKRESYEDLIKNEF